MKIILGQSDRNEQKPLRTIEKVYQTKQNNSQIRRNGGNCASGYESEEI